MQKIKIRKPVKGYKLGDVYTVSNNVAHRLIDNGYAELYEAETVEEEEIVEVEKEEKYEDTESKRYDNRMLQSEDD